jgi:tRNA pseudouridine38-40 synthase
VQRYFIQLSFQGTRYHGWQIQPNGISVQEVLGKSLSLMLREKTEVTGAGRTDAGVHSTFFVAHFDSADYSLDNPDFMYHLNRFLPEDLAVQRIWKVVPDAHARFSAVSRTYIYIISRLKDPFLTGTSYYYPGELDIEKMNQACRLLSGTHDFTSFSRLHTDVKTNICTVKKAVWDEKDNKLLFTITADRFLRNMVRAITGTLIDIGRGKITIDDFQKIIEKKDRRLAGASVPAHGLFLVNIGYPEGI